MTSDAHHSEEDAAGRSPASPETRPGSSLWGSLAVILSFIPVAGLFTLSRTFYVRDLTIAFHPRFEFVRRTILQGGLPFWDPYPGNGQAAVNDPLYQLFHLPSLLIRLLLPETPAFNAWVALPVPLAALGTFLFLRKHVGPIAAAFGAVAFAASGPVASSTNFPNLSWSLVAAPFVFWALERLFERRSVTSITLLAVVISTQALAGEPVTLFTTGCIALAYVAVRVIPVRDWRLAGQAVVGFGAGALLSAVQYAPMLYASAVSKRAVSTDTTFWTFHPLALFELVAPHFFGDYFAVDNQQLVWMTALNSGRDPFFYSMYLGVPIAILALAASLSGRRDTRFWVVVSLVCALASLGSYTPFYPVLKMLLPPLRLFRYPVKYLAVTAFGVAVLAATALQWLLDGDVSRATTRRLVVVTGAVVVLLYVGLAWLLVAPTLPIQGAFRLALWARLTSPLQGAEFLLYRARPLLTALFLKVLFATLLFWVAASKRRERSLAIGVLAVAAMVDLLASNASVNPTIERQVFDTPAWVATLPPDARAHDRVYVGGRLGGSIKVLDRDAPKYAIYPEGRTMIENRSFVTSEFLPYPSGATVREVLTNDLPELWSANFATVTEYFDAAPAEPRLRFLRRVGVRWVILPRPPFAGAQPLAQLVTTPQMHLYELDRVVSRASVAREVSVGPGVKWEIEGLFSDGFDPARGLLVSQQPPPAAGKVGPSATASATFLEDGVNRVVVRAALPADGYLSLLDTYDPDWHVDVDGSTAPLMRADALFRAVHLTAGEHTVTFTYRPSALYLGALITAATALALAMACVWGRSRAAIARPQ